MSEWVGFLRPAGHITGHVGDEPFQAINYTGTDNQNKETKHSMHPERKHQNPAIVNTKKLTVPLLRPPARKRRGSYSYNSYSRAGQVA